jgi:hypothetical protein
MIASIMFVAGAALLLLLGRYPQDKEAEYGNAAAT